MEGLVFTLFLLVQGIQPVPLAMWKAEKPCKDAEVLLNTADSTNPVARIVCKDIVIKGEDEDVGEDGSEDTGN